MQKKIYSVLVIVFAASCLFLYSTLLTSSLRLERNKSLFNAQYYSKSGVIAPPIKLEGPNFERSWLFNRFFQNPAEIELYLRTELFYNEMNNSQHLTDLYQLLLESRPTWPYFYSGLAQVDQVNKQLQFTHINKAMSFGAHERKVVNSLAEILFYNWDSLELMSRNRILDYLSNQPSWSIAQSINISAKFSRVYEYCDFLYEKKQVEYATCKRHYWQPLTGV